MRCAFCNRENPEYAVVCENCGAFLNASDDPWSGNGILDPIRQDRVRCSYCWHDNPGSAKNCEVCGMPLMFVPKDEASMASYQASAAESESAMTDPSAEEPSGEEQNTQGSLESEAIPCGKCGHRNPWYCAFCEECGEALINEETGAVNSAVHRRVNRESPAKEQEIVLTELKKETYADKLRRVQEDDTPEVRRIKCVACGTFNSPKAEFCMNCGVNLTKPFEHGKTYICSECGEINHVLARFCVKCGALLKKKPGETANAEQVSAKPSVEGGAGEDFYHEPTLAELIERHYQSLSPRKPKKSQTMVRIIPKSISKLNRCKYCFHSNPINATVCKKCGTPVLRDLNDV